MNAPLSRYPTSLHPRIHFRLQNGDTYTRERGYLRIIPGNGRTEDRLAAVWKGKCYPISKEDSEQWPDELTAFVTPENVISKRYSRPLEIKDISPDLVTHRATLHEISKLLEEGTISPDTAIRGLVHRIKTRSPSWLVEHSPTARRAVFAIQQIHKTGKINAKWCIRASRHHRSEHDIAAIARTLKNIYDT